MKILTTKTNADENEFLSLCWFEKSNKWKHLFVNITCLFKKNCYLFSFPEA